MTDAELSRDARVRALRHADRAGGGRARARAATRRMDAGMAGRAMVSSVAARRLAIWRWPRRASPRGSHAGLLSARPLDAHRRDEVGSHATGSEVRHPRYRQAPRVRSPRHRDACVRHRREHRHVQHRALRAPSAAPIRAARRARVHVRRVQPGESGVGVAARLSRLP